MVSELENGLGPITAGWGPTFWVELDCELVTTSVIVVTVVIVDTIVVVLTFALGLRVLPRTFSAVIVTGAVPVLFSASRRNEEDKTCA